jgi:phosphate-selective porin OprO/OprP
MQKNTIAWAIACAFAGIAAPLPPDALAQDATEVRIRKLEEQLQAVTEELLRLKEEAAAKRAQEEAAARPSAPAPAAAAPAEDAQALRKEVDALKAKVSEVQDQASATEAKIDQGGVRAYLGPGLIFEDPRGRWRMQVSGRAQLDYRAFAPDFTSADTFSIRRARVGVSATILNDYAVFVEEEFANQNTNPSTATANPILTFAYVDLNWFRPNVRFRLGQFKPSITLDNMMLDLQTDFLERSFTQNLLGSVYDAGVQVFGEPMPGLFYAGSVTNGAGQGNSEPQSNLQQATKDGKMWTVRLVNDFAQTFRIPDSVIHLGGAYQQTGFANSNQNQTPFTATAVQTEARGITFFLPQAFNPSSGGLQIGNVNRAIFDLEAALARGPFRLQGDYMEAKYSSNVLSTNTDFDRTLKAWYVTAGWVITGENYSDWYREGTFIRPRPKNNFGFDKGDGWGLWELNLRYSSFDGTDFNNGNRIYTGRLGTSSNFPNITQGTNKADAWTLGLKWLPNLYTRIAVNLIRTRFDTPVVVNGRSTDYENAITFRTQVDF